MVDFDIENIWRSKNLVYRSPENNDRDKKFFDALIKDPSRSMYVTGNLLRPESREATEHEFKSFMKNKALAVFMCLPKSAADAAAEPETAQATAGSASDGKKAEDDDDGLVPVGMLSLSGGSTEDYDHDHHHRSLWLVLSIAKSYRNRGFGREAINWALDWSFIHAGMHSVGLGCFEFNERGRHLYESLGFTCSGCFRKEFYFNRKWWDVLLYGMLEEEWEALREKEREKSLGDGSETDK